MGLSRPFDDESLDSMALASNRLLSVENGHQCALTVAEQIVRERAWVGPLTVEQHATEEAKAAALEVLEALGLTPYRT
jgi:hypothetical protein